MVIADLLEFLYYPLGATHILHGSSVPDPAPTTPEQVAAARKHLLVMAGILGAGAIAPAAYAAYKASGRRKKKKMTEKELRLGRALESGGSAYSSMMMTALASPAIALPIAYVGVQKLEDGQVISKGLGDAVQTLMTVAVAAPIIQGIGQFGASAFGRK